MLIRSAPRGRLDPGGEGASSDTLTEAWTLNVSRGGLRVVVEDPVAVGEVYQIQVGDTAPRPARVVWVRDETDGQIAGMQFLDVEAGEVPSSSYPPSS